jgi:hypothetical protein
MYHRTLVCTRTLCLPGELTLAPHGNCCLQAELPLCALILLYIVTRDSYSWYYFRLHMPLPLFPSLWLSTSAPQP